MYKLKDIISSGGTNPKINKAIDRYELSKDEKKDIISTIKTNVPQSGGSGGGGEPHAEYYSIDWEKVKELGLINDNGELNSQLVAIFSQCDSAYISLNDIVNITKISFALSQLSRQSMSISEIIKTFKKVIFTPFNMVVAQNGNIFDEKKYNTLSDIYPAWNTQGIFTPITEEEFYTI